MLSGRETEFDRRPRNQSVCEESAIPALPAFGKKKDKLHSFTHLTHLPESKQAIASTTWTCLLLGLVRSQPARKRELPFKFDENEEAI